MRSGSVDCPPLHRPRFNVAAALLLLGVLWGASRAHSCGCGPAEDPTIIETKVVSGSYTLKAVTRVPAKDGGVAEAGARDAGPADRGLSDAASGDVDAASLPAVTLTVDRANNRATVLLPSGRSFASTIWPLPHAHWPRGCRQDPNTTNTPATWHGLEALQLDLPRLEAAGQTFIRPLLIAGCPGSQAVITEYRVEWLRSLPSALSAATDAGGDARGGGPAGLWICGQTPCLIFGKTP